MNAKIKLAAVCAVGTMLASGESVEVTGDSAETLGMVKIPKSTAVNSEIVLGVPFMKGPAGDTNTVSSLLVAGYGADEDEGDTIHVWNPSKPASRGYDTWETWPADDGSNKWLTVSDGVEKPSQATSYAVNRGTAFWFMDVSGNTNDLVHAGLVKPGAQSFVAAGTVTKPVKTLLINPYYADINAAEALATGPVTGDQMSLIGGTVRYEYKEGFGWGTWQKGDVVKQIGSIVIYGPNKFVVADNIPVAGGSAFWYISKGGAPVVEWDGL